jgi:hypothetical protein
MRWRSDDRRTGTLGFSIVLPSQQCPGEVPIHLCLIEVFGLDHDVAAEATKTKLAGPGPEQAYGDEYNSEDDEPKSEDDEPTRHRRLLNAVPKD